MKEETLKSLSDCCGQIAREKTSRELLIEKRDRLSKQLLEIEELLKSLPLELPYQADNGLKRLLGYYN